MIILMIVVCLWYSLFAGCTRATKEVHKM